jgi:APA family basic amino acid/polyamine antiporter
MEKLNKKYGLFTAICMVVGIVIGSGIFFKAKDVLNASGGNALFSTLAWIISGIIMVIIATTFAIMATKYEKVNGAVDYAEAMCGKRYAYYVGWFMSLIYYPAMTAVLAWVTARYTLVACGYVEAPLAFLPDGNSTLNSPECITLALFYLILAFFVNTIAPRLAGKFQISATLIKLVPIAFIAIVGTIIGLANGRLIENFELAGTLGATGTDGTGLFPAICSTIFAYEGWIVATSINSEMKDSKKNLPIALCVGTLIIVAAYTLYSLAFFIRYCYGCLVTCCKLMSFRKSYKNLSALNLNKCIRNNRLCIFNGYVVLCFNHFTGCINISVTVSVAAFLFILICYIRFTIFICNILG